MHKAKSVNGNTNQDREKAENNDGTKDTKDENNCNFKQQFVNFWEWKVELERVCEVMRRANDAENKISKISFNYFDHSFLPNIVTTS